MDFGDIFKKIPEMLNPPEKEMISSAIVGVAGAINPVLDRLRIKDMITNQTLSIDYAQVSPDRC